MSRKLGVPKEPVLLIATGFGLAYPPGFRVRVMSVFIRWRKIVWCVRVETEMVHRATGHSGGSRHAKCAAGSVLVLDEDCFTTLYGCMMRARANGLYEGERGYACFCMRPTIERDGRSLLAVVSSVELGYEDIEDVARNLVKGEGADVSNLHFVWKDRNDDFELQYWRKDYDASIERLRTGKFPQRREIMTAKEVKASAVREKVTTAEIRQQLLLDGYEEDDDGDFVRVLPPVDGGDGGRFETTLCELAAKHGDKGRIYLSPHAWPAMYYEAGGLPFFLYIPGGWGWIGYLSGKKIIVAIPLDGNPPVLNTLPAPPNILRIMRCVRGGRREAGWSKTGWAGKPPAQKNGDNTKTEEPPEEKSGDANGETKT